MGRGPESRASFSKKASLAIALFGTAVSGTFIANYQTDIAPKITQMAENGVPREKLIELRAWNDVGYASGAAAVIVGLMGLLFQPNPRRTR